MTGSVLPQPVAPWLYSGQASPFVPPTNVLSLSWPLGLRDESSSRPGEGPSSPKSLGTEQGLVNKTSNPCFIYPKKTPNLPCRQGCLLLQAERMATQGCTESLADRQRKWGRTPVLVGYGRPNHWSRCLTFRECSLLWTSRPHCCWAFSLAKGALAGMTCAGT